MLKGTTPTVLVVLSRDEERVHFCTTENSLKHVKVGLAIPNIVIVFYGAIHVSTNIHIFFVVTHPFNLSWFLHMFKNLRHAQPVIFQILAYVFLLTRHKGMYLTSRLQ